MAVKIKDIARHLNVSPATVSMVLNNRPGISEETRARVLEAVRALDYQPTSTKRALQGVAGVLPFIVYRKHGEVMAETPFFASMFESVENEARNNGYQLSIHYLSAQSENLESELKTISAGSENGIMIMATEMDREDCLHISRLNTPYVLIDNSMAGVSASKVLMNNYDGVWQAVAQLYSQGHRKIGYLHSSVWINNFDERSNGFCDAMRYFGLEIKEEWTYSLHSTHEGAYRSMLTFCDQAKSYPSALFADNDIIAVGAMKALKEYRISIPRDISIIGFDDMPYCTLVDPNLSTMRVDTQAIASQAVKLLLSKESCLQTSLINTTYIPRESVRTI